MGVCASKSSSKAVVTAVAETEPPSPTLPTVAASANTAAPPRSEASTDTNQSGTSTANTTPTTDASLKSLIPPSDNNAGNFTTSGTGYSSDTVSNSDRHIPGYSSGASTPADDGSVHSRDRAYSGNPNGTAWPAVRVQYRSSADEFSHMPAADFKLEADDKLTSFDEFPVVEITTFPNSEDNSKKYVVYREDENSKRTFDLDSMKTGEPQTPDDGTGAIWLTMESKKHPGVSLKVMVYRHQGVSRLAIKQDGKTNVAMCNEIAKESVFGGLALFRSKADGTSAKLTKAKRDNHKVKIKVKGELLENKLKHPHIHDLLRNLRVHAVNGRECHAKDLLSFTKGGDEKTVKATLTRVRGAAIHAFETVKGKVLDGCVLLADTGASEIKEAHRFAIDDVHESMLRFVPQALIDARREKEHPKHVELPDGSKVAIHKQEMQPDAEYGFSFSHLVKSVIHSAKKVVSDPTVKKLAKTAIDVATPAVTAAAGATLGPTSGIVAQKGMQTLKGVFGAVPTPATELKKKMLKGPEHAELPPEDGKLMHQVHGKKIINQQKSPICTACASSAAVAIMSGVPVKSVFDEVLEKVGPTIKAQGGASIGLSLGEAAKVLSKAMGKTFEAKSINATADMIKHAIVSGVPVVTGMDFDHNITHGAEVGPIPELEGGGLKHCVLIVGYDDADHTYTVLNSWGPKWGVMGYFFVKQAYAGIDEAWVLHHDGVLANGGHYGLEMPDVDATDMDEINPTSEYGLEMPPEEMNGGYDNEVLA